jgi:GNAT superfamily N-acetyltransferase
MSDFSLREAEHADARAIADMHVRAWQSAYRDLMPDEFLGSLSVDRGEQGWQRYLAHDEPRTWVAERDGAIVGFSSAGATRDGDVDANVVGELWAINLVEEVWGCGLGATLFATAVDHLRARGYSEATLWVLDGNARARRFYEKHGWHFDGAEKDDDRRTFVLHELRYRAAL